MGSQHLCCLEIGHEAAVGQDQFKVHASVFQGLIPFVQSEHAWISGLIRKELVGEKPVRTAAVVPHDEHVLICRIGLFSPGNEVAQGFRIAHGRTGLLVDELEAFRCVSIPLQLFSADVKTEILCLPLLAAAGLDDEIDIFRWGRFRALRQVIGGTRIGRGIALEVAAAHSYMSGASELLRLDDSE